MQFTSFSIFRWVHKSSYCEWEWTSEGVVETGCSLGADPRAELARAGDYEVFECGLEFTALPQHRGVWICELERYHPGFSR